MKKTIGFLGGTFDPIHFGHISLAIQLLEMGGLDEVLFCPAFCSPFKGHAPPIATPEQRLEMLHLALAGISYFRVTPVEIDRGGPSYTIDTLRILKSDSKAMRLLLSEEAVSQFDLWKEPGELIRIAPPLVGTRTGAVPLKGALGDALKKVTYRTKVIEISSTEVRDRLNKGLYCGHLIPAKTLDYIHTHRLYSYYS